MMKFSRILTLVLSLAMLLSMAACGNNQSGKDEPQVTNPENAVYNELNEVQLTGSFELQIFVGGYGSEAWEYAIAEFQKLNPDLEIEGIVFTMYDARTNLSLQVVENVKRNLNQNIYKHITNFITTKKLK